MPRSYSTGKRDANEGLIVSFYERIGAYVEKQSESASFDLLVIYRGMIIIVEVKDPAKFAKKLTPYEAACNMLTPDQVNMKFQCERRNVKYWVVWDIETAKESVGIV